MTLCNIGGFTLIEVLVVVLIIAVLTAVAVPMYKRAVLKSRFSTVMPMAKSVADAQEIYYLGNGYYAQNDQKNLLDISNTDVEKTAITLSGKEGYDYVLAQRTDVPELHYVVYQRNSENYPGEIHCEAQDDNANAQYVCKSFGGTQDIGKTITDGYTTYIINGTGAGTASGAGEGGNGDNEGGTETSTPLRELEGDPVCNNYTGMSSCTYTYETGEKLKRKEIFSKNYTWNCDSAGHCASLTLESSDTNSVTTQMIFDSLSQDNMYYDSNGNIYAVEIQRDPYTLYYDSEGNFYGAYSYTQDKWAYYDAQGNVYATTVGGVSYNYNASNTPNLSNEELTTFGTIAQSYVGKTKCQLYPELQDCASGN